MRSDTGACGYTSGGWRSRASRITNPGVAVYSARPRANALQATEPAAFACWDRCLPWVIVYVYVVLAWRRSVRRRAHL